METSCDAGRIGGVIDFLSEYAVEKPPSAAAQVLPYDFGPMQYDADELERDWWSKQLGTAA
jgi:hypothetical protein